MVGMVRNWLFTLFYCISELWGDVVLSLLFWGLANETTSIEDAPLLYPLFDARMDEWERWPLIHSFSSNLYL